MLLLDVRFVWGAERIAGEVEGRRYMAALAKGEGHAGLRVHRGGYGHAATGWWVGVSLRLRLRVRVRAVEWQLLAGVGEGCHGLSFIPPAHPRVPV